MEKKTDVTELASNALLDGGRATGEAFDFDKWVRDMWNSESVDAHRRGISDGEWSGMQPNGDPNFRIGDVVEFKVGGFGVIAEVKPPHGGHPSKYSTRDVEGFPGHSSGKMAWHYELDFARLVAGSPLRSLKPNASGQPGHE